MFCKATLTRSFRVRERPAKTKFEMHQIHRACRLRIPSDLNEQLTSVVKLTSVSSTIGYGQEYVLFFFQRDYVHITVYIILRDDVIM